MKAMCLFRIGRVQVVLLSSSSVVILSSEQILKGAPKSRTVMGLISGSIMLIMMVRITGGLFSCPV
jgi:hypothetical protein